MEFAWHNILYEDEHVCIYLEACLCTYDIDKLTSTQHLETKFGVAKFLAEQKLSDRQTISKLTF